MLNVTAMYSCIDRANTIYTAPPPLRQEKGGGSWNGNQDSGFFPWHNRQSQLVPHPEHKRSAIYVASRGHEDSDDFYQMYQQSGLKGLEFQRVVEGEQSAFPPDQPAT